MSGGYLHITQSKFPGYCNAYTNIKAAELINQVKTELDRPNLAKKNLVWLELTGCAGNIISLLDGEDPGIDYMMSQMVNLVYEHSLVAAEGECAMEQLFSVLDQDFILAVEGAVATKNNGLYNIIGNWRGQVITALNAIKMLGAKASYIIAVGACATHGGVSAASPNPAECVSIQSVLENRVIINLPGCPCHPEWFLGTLAHLLLYGMPELDSYHRPIIFYGTTIHEKCERRSYFDNGIFASKLGEPTCMFRLGCKGPITFIDCPIRKWNQAVNWPVQDNTPCIGCAQFGFPDAMEPFITYPTPAKGWEGQNND